jgi:hypothetical protein
MLSASYRGRTLLREEFQHPGEWALTLGRGARFFSDCFAWIQSPLIVGRGIWPRRLEVFPQAGESLRDRLWLGLLGERE